jgi:hypothetical protein
MRRNFSSYRRRRLFSVDFSLSSPSPLSLSSFSEHEWKVFLVLFLKTLTHTIFPTIEMMTMMSCEKLQTNMLFHVMFNLMIVIYVVVDGLE